MHTQAVACQEMFYYFCHILPIYPGKLGFFMIMRKTNFMLKSCSSTFRKLKGVIELNSKVFLSLKKSFFNEEIYNFLLNGSFHMKPAFEKLSFVRDSSRGAWLEAAYVSGP